MLDFGMRSNFILLFPLFILSLYYSQPIKVDESGNTCTNFKVTVQLNATCYGSATGSIVLGIKGGVPPYKVKWNNGYTSQKITGLSEGTYSATVSDRDGCQWEKSFRVKSYQEIRANIQGSASWDQQNPGSIEVSISGGKPPYTYNWIDATGVISKVNTHKLSDLPKGKYWIAVTDDNRCTSVFKADVR